MDSRARACLDLIDQLKSERSALDGLWEDIARRVWPDYAVFQRAHHVNLEGDRRSFELFDATGAVALDRFASALMKMTAPSSRKWHKLTVSDDDLAESYTVKAWLEQVNNVLFRRRYAKQSNFASQYLECCKTIGAFGPMATLVDEMYDAKSGQFFNRYKALHLSTTYFTEDAWGRVNGFARTLQYTAGQCAERFGMDALPPKMRSAAESKNQADRLRKWEIVHCVQPGQTVADGAFSFESIYCDRESKTVLQDGGYRALPIAAARFSTMPGEKYGRSPAMLVLPSLKMLQEMKKTWLRAAHKAVDPPLLAHDDGVLSVINTGPGKITMGTVTDEGRPLVQPLQSGTRLDYAEAAIADERKPINDVFLVTLFQILADEPRQQTATEVVERAAEKATLLSPAVERLQSEYHGTMIEREIDLAIESGELPPMPDELQDRYHEVKVEYLGELNQAQKADEVAGIMRTAEVAPAFQALDPTSVKRVKWDKAYARLAEGFGVPLEFLSSDEEMDAAREQDQQIQAAAALVEAAPAAGQAAAQFAKVEQLRAQTSAAGASPAGPLF